MHGVFWWFGFFCGFLIFFFILVLSREGEVRGISVPLVCLRKHYVLPLYTRGKKKGERESDGGKTGEENLLGMGFFSVENCQLGFLL